MSQKAVFVRVNGNLHTEVLASIPDYEDMVQICKDMGYKESDSDAYFGSLEVEYEWLEIYPKGTEAGESDMDYYLEDGALCYLYDSYDNERNFMKAGYEYDFIEHETCSVDFEDLEDK